MRVAHVKLNSLENKFQYAVSASIRAHENVLVKTSNGIESGEVIKIIDTEKNTSALNVIERIMTKQDFFKREKQAILETELLNTAQDLAEKLELNMNVIKTHISFDETYILIQFEADQRVDFRELVKKLSSLFHSRIEMKQIGSRDVAKIRGGIGPCGLLLCCSTFIGEFDAISIKMAKNQSLSLNPQKISGLCGKLLCCLKYEDETYDYLKRSMPQQGSLFVSEYGEGKVIDINYISRKAKLRHRDGFMQWIDIQDSQA